MKITRREHLALLGGAALVATPLRAVADGHATVHEVEMRNVHPDDRKERMVFVPDVIRANPGDTIRFIAVDKGHNSEANADMLPAGADAWKGKISNDVEVVVGVEGAYGFHCTPHRTVGMVGLILVGDVSGNYEAVRAVRQRGKAKARYEEVFARADALLAAEA